MRSARTVIWSLACIVALAISSQTPASPQATTSSARQVAIRAGKLIDGVADTPISNPTILIEGDRITAIGQNVQIPKDASTIDLGSATVLPGLIDSHTHLLSNQNGAIGGYGVNLILEVNQLSTAKRALMGAALARQDLEAGITTVRDLGNSGRNGDVALRDAIQAGWVTGPRMVVATRALAPIGGQFGTLTPEAQKTVEQEYAVISGVDEARRAVTQAVYDGADCIKVIVDSGGRVLSSEEVKAVVEQAQLLGRKVAAHATTDQAARIAAEASVNSIEHAYTISDDVLKLMAERKIFLVPTDHPIEAFDAITFKDRHPTPEERQQFQDTIRSLIQGSRDRLKRAIRFGVPIAAGSDMYLIYPGKTRGQASLGMIRAYAEAGMSPLEIIRSLTRNAAELLGVQLGTVEKGKFADLIAVRNDPLQDITELERVGFVMKAGLVVRDDLSRK